MKKLFKLFAASALVGLAGFATTCVQAAPVLPSSVYTFSGNCIDCAQALAQTTREVSATVVMQTYLPGDGAVASASYFYSFTYNGSNLIEAFTIDSGNLLDFDSGGFGAAPGSAAFYVTGRVASLGDEQLYFRSYLDGTWALGYGFDVMMGNEDFGVDGVYTVASVTLPTDTQNVPEPGSLLLAGAGLAAVAMARRRRAV